MSVRIIYPLAGALVLFVVVLPFFIKVGVECQSQFGVCPSEIDVQLNRFDGNSLFRARQESSKYLAKNYLVSDFSMQFKIPNMLYANLLVKKPVFAILDRSTGKNGLVDKDGRIISVSSSSSLPTVAVMNTNLQAGGNVSAREYFALELMQGIWQMYQVSLGEIKDDSLVVELPGGVTVTFPREGNKEVLLGEVRLVYGKVESMGTASKYSQIDLRFKNPVLR